MDWEGMGPRGLAVALATPFTEQGAVDLDSFRRLVRHVVAGGADVLVPLGSTGEAATLDEAERDLLIETCLAEADGRMVLAGTGSNATAVAARWTARAQVLGAHGALVVTPYYNKPTVDGLVAHYRAVAEAAPGLPLVAYNVPGRTGLNLTPAALARLWENEQVVAVKESSGDLAQIGAIARELPAGKVLLSGDDNLALASIALGASGVVSVTGNLLPGTMKTLVDHALAGRAGEARGVHQGLLPLMDALFTESNPIPLKAGLALLGLGGDGVRLPLVRAKVATRQRLLAALEQAGVSGSEGTLVDRALAPGASTGAATSGSPARAGT
ncbi:MAG: 4-hydroxy-tetrahydrodipicolinate synthase [Planctomycetota bacterium]|jgi:4-hydroxy-tetrahydrodipicolinate synthase